MVAVADLERAAQLLAVFARKLTKDSSFVL
jgi:hypothetical protein